MAKVQLNTNIVQHTTYTTWLFLTEIQHNNNTVAQHVVTMLYAMLYVVYDNVCCIICTHVFSPLKIAKIDQKSLEKNPKCHKIPNIRSHGLKISNYGVY